MNKYKYMCLVVLGFCMGFFSGKAHGLELNMDAHCLAQNIYFEAGNQPLAGKVAVANVTMNRVEHENFPNDICGVVYQTKAWRVSWTGKKVPQLGMCQFSWFCDGKSDKPKDSKTWAECLEIANDIIDGHYFDLTEGSMWYHADYIRPYWADHLNQTIHLDTHIFYR